MVAVLGYEEHYVLSESEVKVSDTGPPRAARPQPPFLPRHPFRPRLETLFPTLALLS